MNKLKKIVDRARDSLGITSQQPPPLSAPADPELAERGPAAEPPTREGSEPGARSRFWPEGEKLPAVHVKPLRRLLPCQKCRRVLLDDGGQALACQSSGEISWWRCRACGHLSKYPVRRV